MADRRPLVLFRTSYFGQPPNLDVVGSEHRACFTTDVSRIAEADAVVFHIPDWRPSQLTDTPKYPGQKWVAWSQESAINYPRLADRSFMRHFDLTMTYERSADVWAPYLPRAEDWETARAAPIPDKVEAAPLVMFQSALIDGSERNAFSIELMRHIKVDSYGRVLRNRRIEGPDRGRQTKLEVIGRYRFCLALENSISPDYVTEKLFDPLMAGTVPVYRGTPTASAFAPEHSYIDATGHGGVRGLAEYLRHLMQAPAEYEAYFAWRNQPLPPVLEDKLAAAAQQPLLRLLEFVGRGEKAPAGRPHYPFGLGAALRTRLGRGWRALRPGPERTA